VTGVPELLGLIADIHGNDVALGVVLDELRRERITDVVCLGDVAATGPRPAATLDLVRATGCPVVMGNADAFLLDPAVGSDDEVLRRFEEIDSWCARQLSPEARGFVQSFEPAVTVESEGGLLLCYHGSPRSFDDVIMATTPADELDELLSGHTAALFAGGHTHFPMYRRHAGALVINPGSVGMAYDRTHPEDQVRLAPWAEYAVVTISRQRASVDLRRVPYDTAPVIEAIEGSDMPHAPWLAAEWGS
jgi:predicted phosphodiesterase